MHTTCFQAPPKHSRTHARMPPLQETECEGSHLLQCDRCGMAVHQDCYGVGNQAQARWGRFDEGPYVRDHAGGPVLAGRQTMSLCQQADTVLVPADTQEDTGFGIQPRTNHQVFIILIIKGHSLRRACLQPAKKYAKLTA